MWRASPGFSKFANGKASQSANFNDRISFELHEEDIEAVRARVSGFGFPKTTAPSRSLPVSNDENQQAYAAWRAKYPCILTQMDKFKELLEGKRLAVFLDYDGTLTPIVSNPDDAVMSPEMRSVVRKLAQQFPTAIISGRGREKVEGFVQLPELFYAGSHGMDIAGPKELNGCAVDHNSTFQPAAQFKPVIDAVCAELTDRLKDIPGAVVEHNTFCVSAHFRNCPGESWQDVISVVDDIVSNNSQLRMTRGRKVVEVRPKVDWHKGTALNHLVSVLGLSQQEDVLAIYIGDDHTDEDAFKTLEQNKQGFGILVSTKVKPTEARYTVKDPAEVQLFLAKLVEWGFSESNGWHKQPSCTGWKASVPRS